MYKPNFTTIHHIAIIVSNYEVSKNFYANILGLNIIRETFRPEKEDIKIDLQISSNTELELFVKDDAPIRPSYPEASGLRHLSFHTQSIEEDIKYLKKCSVRVDDLRIDDITGKKMVFFYDPDNLPIELHE